jgi:capsular exopolysaccharide synthesis family protein
MKKPPVKPEYEVIASKTMDLDIDPRVIAFYEPDSPVSEQYRILRTNIRGLGGKRPVSAVCVTSGTHGEGKSITAVNLAVSFAGDHDKKRVLLADGDLRRANVHRYLGMPPSAGISDIIAGGVSPLECFRDSGIPNLTVLTAGGKVRNPAELLDSQGFRELMGLLRERFDYIIFDAPPVIPVTDSGLIACQCDGALIVVQAGRTQRGIVRHSTGLLRHADGP